MRLLDAWLLIHEGIAELVNFPDERSAPPYAILSHTWEDEEVLFDDMPLGPNHEIVTSRAALRAWRWQKSLESELPDRSRPHVKAGWNKVLNTCLQACRDSLEYVWIDTCCIDKSSSAELSEAINSMYLWYEKSTLCYVLLSDCEICPDFDRATAQIHLENESELESEEAAEIRLLRPHVLYRGLWAPQESADETKYQDSLDEIALNACMRYQLRRCKWFTRGWTLQELLAPSALIFYDKRWQLISNRSSILPTLASITGVPRRALRYGYTSGYSIAQRMFWASKRKTTRIEDEAYCLLGIFGVRLPLIYGEGNQAFLRLQEEIFKVSQDQSILAWELRPGVDLEDCFHRLFAPSVANFWWLASSIEHQPEMPRVVNEFHLTNQGVELQLYLDDYRQQHGFTVSIARLECWIRDNGKDERRIGLRLRNTDSGLANDRNPPQTRMSTHVEVESVSTIEAPAPTFRRLVYLTVHPFAEKRDWHSRKLFVLRNQSFSCCIGHPQASSSLGIAEITLSLRGPTLEQKPWRVIAVHPQSSWHEEDRTMRLPLSRESVFGCVLIESCQGLRFTILIGLVKILRSSLNGNPGGSKHSEFQYWIFPGSPDPWKGIVDKLWSYFTFPWSIAVVKSPDEDQLGLRRLCERAPWFAHKDFFENSARRTDCCKFAHLPNGNILRVKMGDVYDSDGRFSRDFPRTLEVTYSLIMEPGSDSKRTSLLRVALLDLGVSFSQFENRHRTSLETESNNNTGDENESSVEDEYERSTDCESGRSITYDNED